MADVSWISSYVPHVSEWFGQIGPLTWVLLAGCVAVTIPGLINRWKLVSAIEKIPGPQALPVIGNILQFNVPTRALFNAMVSMCNSEGGLTRFWLGSDPNVFIYKANLVEIILTSGSKAIEKARGYKFVMPWLGEGLITSKGKKWHSRRKLLTPTFHFKILEDFIEVFNRQSLKLVNKLSKEHSGEPFNIFPFISRCALDIICETAMGVNLNSQDETESTYLQSVSKMLGLVQYRAARPWLHPDFLFRILGPYNEYYQALEVLHGFTKSAIKQKKQERSNINKSTIDENSDKMKKKRRALLDLLLDLSENQSYLSDEDLREEVDTFMFGGHDTTTASTNWTLYLLGLNPDIQEKVHQELDEVFGDSNRAVTSDNLRQLKYLECCIKESLRIFPSVPMHSRTTTEDLQLDKHFLPSGTTVHMMLFQLHRDPTYFPDPEVYQPERFAPENATGRHPYAFIPFTAGPRNCIGQKFAMMEEKIVLCNILRHFTVKSQVSRKDLHILGELILKPENGNIVTLTPRKRISKYEE